MVGWQARDNDTIGILREAIPRNTTKGKPADDASSCHLTTTTTRRNMFRCCVCVCVCAHAIYFISHILTHTLITCIWITGDILRYKLRIDAVAAFDDYDAIGFANTVNMSPSTLSLFFSTTTTIASHHPPTHRPLSLHSSAVKHGHDEHMEAQHSLYATIIAFLPWHIIIITVNNY